MDEEASESLQSDKSQPFVESVADSDDYNVESYESAWDDAIAEAGEVEELANLNSPLSLYSELIEVREWNARLQNTIDQQKAVIDSAHNKARSLQQKLSATAKLEDILEGFSKPEADSQDMKELFDAKIETIRSEIARSEERTSSKLDNLISQHSSDSSEMKLILSNAMDKITSTESRTEAKADELKSTVSSAKYWAIGTAIAVTSIVLTSTFRFNALTTKASDINVAWTKELILRVEEQSQARDKQTAEAVIAIKDSLKSIAAKLDVPESAAPNE